METVADMERVDEKLHSIKGGGACQLREKVLAEAAETWVIVADYRKNSKVLGTNVCSTPYTTLAIPISSYLLTCRVSPTSGN